MLFFKKKRLFIADLFCFFSENPNLLNKQISTRLISFYFHNTNNNAKNVLRIEIIIDIARGLNYNNNVDCTFLMIMILSID